MKMLERRNIIKTLIIFIAMALIIVMTLFILSNDTAKKATIVVQPGIDGNDVWLEGNSNKNSYDFLIVGKQGGYPNPA